MARIPDAEIKRLKQEVSLERLAEARGIKLKRHGKELMGLCPFHKDREPSLCIDPVQNVWSCKGACQTGGSVVDWVMRAQGISFRHAVELLRNEHPSLAAPSGHVVRKGTTDAVKLEAPFERSAEDGRVLQQVIDYYHDTLKQSPEALKYLRNRSLDHPEMIDHFRLGFSNRTLGYRLPEKNRKAGAEVRGRLQQLGILRDTGHEHFTGSVVFPVFDLNGNVTEMYGRKITPGLRPGTPLHMYLPGPHKGVWNEEALVLAKEIILCESIIDALTFWCADYRNVTASYGANGFTPDHRAALKKHGTKKVLIAYDRDEAGEKAALALADELIGMGIDCYRVLFPKGMDANEYGSKVKPTGRSLGLLLNSIKWLGKGKPPTVTVPETLESAPVADEPESPPEPIAEARSPAAKEETAAEPEAVFPLAAEPMPTEPAPPPTAAAAVEIPEPQPEPADDSAAMPAPQPGGIDVVCEIQGETIFVPQGDRRYRIRGLFANTGHQVLKVNICVSRKDAVHVDALDMTLARHRAVFAKQASEELGVKDDVIRHDLGRMLLKLESLRDEAIQKTLEPKDQAVQIGPEEETAALELLRDPRLMERILEDFARCGVVGEETNKKVAYLAAVSRLLDAPLAVIVQSSSAAGKSSLMEAVLALMPEEQRVQYSAMTGQSLFYMGETDLKNKILAIVEEEGAQRAAYALKLLQSEGVLTIASTGKDPATGKLTTHQYRVEGPVMILLTTTAIEIDEELLNRCLVLTVDEDREQTRAIHRIQREAQTLEGLLAKRRRQAVLALHRNAQRLLRPIPVVNPYAERLTFPDSLTRTRRDHMKFLSLIRAVTLLYQHQRPIKTVMYDGKPLEYIESTPEDVELAEDLIRQVLGRSLDELPPQTRRLLLLVDDLVTEQCEQLKMHRTDYHFSRRDVRQYTGWSDAQVKRHLHKLEELEYLIVHHGGRGQTLVYELFFDRPADPRQPFLPGLIDLGKLHLLNYDENKDGGKGQKDASNTPQVRAKFGGSTGVPESITTGLRNGFRAIPGKNTDTGKAPSAAIVAAGRS
ncbi:MAG: toprim domain-containing protein [Bryobacteraceae bacterium]|jgi:DNA primase catalytic core